ncbi:DNA-binding GntR family transcriptional regulator [Thermobifida halotolerans]
MLPRRCRRQGRAKHAAEVGRGGDRLFHVVEGQDEPVGTEDGGRTRIVLLHVDTAEIAERLAINPGDEVMRTRYVFTGDDEPVMPSTSWELLELTRGTAIVLPEDGPHAGRGVVERMAVIGQRIVHATEIVTARTATADETDRLGLGRGAVVMVIRRTYSAGERPGKTADIVVPPDRYELACTILVEH